MQAGRIESYLHSTPLVENKCGSIVKVTCKTDFAARILDFKEFAYKVAKLACGFQVDSWDELVKQMPTIEQDRKHVEELLRENVRVEKILLVRLEEDGLEAKGERSDSQSDESGSSPD